MNRIHPGSVLVALVGRTPQYGIQTCGDGVSGGGKQQEGWKKMWGDRPKSLSLWTGNETVPLAIEAASVRQTASLPSGS